MPRDGLDVLLEKIGMLQLRLRRLGTIGCNHLPNPKYNSPHSRYVSIFTAAEIEGDPLTIEAGLCKACGL